MSKEITTDIIASFTEQLETHPVYDAVATLSDLQCFMEHHVYSVWDFMSLLKYIQSVVAPTKYPWLPQGDPSVRRFINELVLEEESDTTNKSGEFSSHFELYQKAMSEIGAKTVASTTFIQTVHKLGIDNALQQPFVPLAAQRFVTTTFGFIQNDQPHQVAAALALGREHIIPSMFRAVLERIGVTEAEAPTFYFYLNRHIHLDDGFHAPLSLRLLNGLCGEDEVKIQEAIAAANRAIHARITFWDEVLESIVNPKIKHGELISP